MPKLEAIYARQSIYKEDSVSIEAQIAKCKEKCKTEEPVIYQDKGYSGKDTNRPDFKRLVEDIEAGLIDRLIVYKIDRVSRNIADFYALWKKMEGRCTLISTENDIDTSSPMGKASMNLIIMFAELERDTITTRIIGNVDYRLRQKVWLGGVCPYGYERIKYEGKKILKPVEDEMKVVKLIFKLYTSSKQSSIYSIRQTLDDKKILSPKGKRGWNTSTVNAILQNPIYARADKVLYTYYDAKGFNFANSKEEWDGTHGACIHGRYIKYTSRKTKGEAYEEYEARSTLNTADPKDILMFLVDTSGKPPITSRTFLIAQDRIKANYAKGLSNKPTNKLKELTGMLKCGKCGGTLQCYNGTTLYCHNHTYKHICPANYAGRGKFQFVRDNVDKEVNEYLKKYRTNRTIRHKTLEMQRSEIYILQKKIDNYNEAIGLGLEDTRQIVEKINETNRQIKEIELRMLKEDQEDIITLRLSDAQHIIGTIFDDDGRLLINYAKMSVEDKQMILRIICDKIFLNEDGTIQKIIWTYSPIVEYKNRLERPIVTVKWSELRFGRLERERRKDKRPEYQKMLDALRKKREEEKEKLRPVWEYAKH